jgi:hypothetical protein
MDPTSKYTLEQVQAEIGNVCLHLSRFLCLKNEAYGNSALDPVRIFSKASTDEQLNVRIDDKLSRLVRGLAGGEDVEEDLLGYLILKKVKRRLDDGTTAKENAEYAKQQEELKNPPPPAPVSHKPVIGSPTPGAARPESREIKHKLPYHDREGHQ